MTQLDAEFAGVSQIIDLWFASYKGPDGGMEGSDEGCMVLQPYLSGLCELPLQLRSPFQGS